MPTFERFDWFIVLFYGPPIDAVSAAPEDASPETSVEC